MDPQARPDAALPRPPALQWDVFCRVIDNLGDIGVCWRLCAQLGAQGQQVRLWIDQPEALAWMAPGALQGLVKSVQVRLWDDTPGVNEAAADVWVESFGCEPPAPQQEWLAHRLQHGGRAPVWINLEYLSAEAYVARSHRLPSLLGNGPLRGLSKWYFYPGLTPGTGGLLREPELLQRQASFQAVSWLAALPGLSLADPQAPRRRVSLFCYEPTGLATVLQQAAQDAVPSDWLITPGRASAAVAAALAPGAQLGEQTRLHHLPLLTQHDFDHLLWSCDLNLVRGEDSLVRALWAAQAFVWQIYPQHDDAHHAKLEVFLDWLQAPASLRSFHRAWNGMDPAPTRWPGWAVVDSWRPCVRAARERLLAQPDLLTQLLGFADEKR
jgi:uncharacterized repeat protein (TIGR03837 family)